MPSGSPAADVWLLLRALRALRAGKVSRCIHLVALLSARHDVPAQPQDVTHHELFEGLVEAIRVASLAQVGRDDDELRRADLPPQEVRRRRARAGRRAEPWSPLQSRLRLRAVLDDDGVPFTDDTLAAQALHTHWAPVCAIKHIDLLSAREILGHAVSLTPVAAELIHVDRRAPDEELWKIIRKTGNSAAGPDGIPYSAWRHAPQEVLNTLVQVFDEFAQGVMPPASFGESIFAFIPKATGSLQLQPGEVAAKPRDLRPLSLANTDNKIIASFVNASLGPIAQLMCFHAQFGFIDERQMGDGVLGLEASALHGVRRSATSALLFLDFCAAFPSIAQAWIWLCMEHMCLPLWIVRVLRALYFNVTGIISFGSAAPISINMLSGIKQGCPASGSIFALIIDPVIRWLSYKISSPINHLVAFADDVAIYMEDFLRHLPSLLNDLEQVQHATALYINKKKTVLIPLWAPDLPQAQHDVAQVDDRASDFEVCWCFKHLGVMVGPSGAACRWTSSLQKYLLRTALVRATRASFARSASLYRSMAFSTLQFLSSFDCPPRSAYVIEAQGISRALGAPMWSMPSDLLASMHELDLPDVLPHLRATSLAARITHLQRLRCWQFVLDKIDENIDANDDQVLMIFGKWEQWRTASLSVQLRAVWRSFTSTGLRQVLQLRPHRCGALGRLLLPDLRNRGPLEVLAARARTLLHHDDAHDAPDDQALQLLLGTRFRSISGLRLPLTCYFSLLRITCNALPTSRRLHLDAQCCPMGCGVDNGSCILHLARCPALRLLVLHRLPGLPGWPGLPGVRQMIFPAQPADDVPLTAGLLVLLDACVHTFITTSTSSRGLHDDARIIFAGETLDARLLQLSRWSAAAAHALRALRLRYRVHAPHQDP